MTSVRRRFTTTLLVLAVVAVAVTAHAQTFSVLYNFGNTGDPTGFSNPGTLAQGRDGNVYTTSTSGGNGNPANGTVFTMSTGGGLSQLYPFTITPNGCNPYSGVTLGTDGNFYGAVPGCGTFVFKITPSGSLTPLYNFTGGSDGGNPNATPVEGNDGNFYGTTQAGGTYGYGTVYKITPSGKLTTLYQFDDTHVASNSAPLVLGTDGNFYGTGYGGANNYGVVYKITPAGKLTVLYNFDFTHGGFPPSSLVQGNDGDFYGVTQEGGTDRAGVVFKITPAGKLTILHNLNGTTDGASPVAGLVQATDGNFYGVTESGGGASSSGTIFRISPTKPYLYKVLYPFDGTTAGFPEVTLLQNTNGLLYGLSNGGGTYTVGTFYSLNLNLGSFVSLLPTSAKVGKTIGILGQKFKGTTGVSFNGTSATFKVVSSTYLTATVPNGATTGFVTVKTPGGTLTSNKQFRVTPVILSFSPTSGPVGTPVKITGTSFTGATKVTFGGVKATVFTVDKDTQITATVPTGAKTGKIAITTPGGTAVSPAVFTVTQ